MFWFFFGREKFRKAFTIALAAGVLGGGVFMFALDKIPQFSHQKERINAFFNPEETSGDEGFNVDQAKVAIGSGQFLGKGFGNGTQSRLNYLPEHQTDFIFAAYAEEFGLLGSMVLLFLYGFLIFKFFYQASNFPDAFGGAIIAIFGFKILIEVFINIGTNTGIIPATGIPLPLFSAGGSVTLATFLILGLIQSIISTNNFVGQNNEIQTI